MKPDIENYDTDALCVLPLCPVFKTCLGCSFQNISYSEELNWKQAYLQKIFKAAGFAGIPEPIVASAEEYNYRNRIDLKLLRTKTNEILVGFTPQNHRGILPISACYIARREISDFIPELTRQVRATLPARYRVANLVVRTGEEGKVFWGGIGKRSLRQSPENYFSATIRSRKIFYSLETFFQANLSILPKLFATIETLPIWGQKTGEKQPTVDNRQKTPNDNQNKPRLFDLYGGVGLFGIGLADLARQVVLVEENPASIKLCHHNAHYNGLTNFEIKSGKMEEHLDILNFSDKNNSAVAIIDPPRAGLSSSALAMFKNATGFQHLLYLSCQPEALIRDLNGLVSGGWQIQRVMPFDFFPKTKHIETLAWLTKWI
ncbi:MAG: class I SAM-dependent RNA methyltransferase [Candidatus Omnitrophica bacterium]|nr:class I SAM-dependent RNA methyltransferase [Candidatus Omnitrophota bacterium]